MAKETLRQDKYKIKWPRNFQVLQYKIKILTNLFVMKLNLTCLRFVKMPAMFCCKCQVKFLLKIYCVLNAHILTWLRNAVKHYTLPSHGALSLLQNNYF